MSNIYKNLIKNSYKNNIVNTSINDSDFIMWKNNNSKSRTLDKCPYCESKEFIKYGMYNGFQRYKCKNDICGKTFTFEIYNKFRCSKKFREKYQDYFKLLNQGLTIRECAKKLNISIVTSFFWRHRFLYDFKSKYYIEKINYHVELTKMVVYENFKGSREVKEDERDKIVVVTALNNQVDAIPIFAARNFFGFYEVRDNILPRLDKKAFVEGFFDGKIENFAKAFNEVNKTICKKEYEKVIDKVYSSKVKRWLSKFKGVATKYLDHYLYLRLFLYKNGILCNEEAESNFDLIHEINTYISWKNIKLKKVSI